MLLLPHSGVRFRDVEFTELNRLVGRYIDLHIIARCEANLLVGIHWFEHEFFNEGGHAGITNDTQLVSLLVTCPIAASLFDIKPQSAVALFDGIGGEAAADRSASG